MSEKLLQPFNFHGGFPKLMRFFQHARTKEQQIISPVTANTQLIPAADDLNLPIESFLS